MLATRRAAAVYRYHIGSSLWSASKACLVSLSQASRCTTILRSSFLLAYAFDHQRDQSGANATYVETTVASKQMDGLKHFSNHVQESAGSDHDGRGPRVSMISTLIPCTGSTTSYS
ncbi:hypothetical protein VNO77_02696 [Canavalia gladiata]|uniref:Uncharacterized protein n=1 Tax=Canavalia gladiata TaxID=3824 RepID=A0AAN9MU41_CANGL